MRKIKLIRITALVLLSKASLCSGQTGAAAQPPPLVDRLVIVGAPKVYDDLYLRNLLTSLQNQLASIHAVDQATLLGHIGMTQGANAQQSSAGLSGSGPTSPQQQTFTLAPGVPAFNPNGVATTTTPGTTTTTPAVNPSGPTPPVSVLTPPAISSLGQSSLDTYNESLQLASQITGTALLLNGAPSDSLQADGSPKATITIGFPITINPPAKSDRDLQNAVAEVRVNVCSNSGEEAPSIVTILPAEKTYNVASLVDKSFLGSLSAVLGGFINVGGSFLWSHKTYYLVQQQDTVALLRASEPCPEGGYLGASFSWQMHPVLGKKFLRPGNSVNFVQLSIPSTAAMAGFTKPVGYADVSVVWHKGDVKGRYVSGPVLKGRDHGGSQRYPVYYYGLQKVNTVEVTDIGQGAVAVKATGTFLPGTTVRLGTALLSPDTITASHDTLTFTAAASAIVSAGRPVILGRDNQPLDLVNGSQYPPAAHGIDIKRVSVLPYSDSQSLVTIAYVPPDTPSQPGVHDQGTPNPAVNPWVVVIGTKVFGLSDAPFRSNDGKEIKLLAETDLLQSSPTIEMRRLLWPDNYFRCSKPITPDLYPKNGPVVAKTVLLTKQGGLTLGLIGTGFDDKLKLVLPSAKECPSCRATLLDSTLYRVVLPTVSVSSSSVRRTSKRGKVSVRKVSSPNPIDGLSQIVLCEAQSPGGKCDPNYPHIVVDISKLDSPPGAKFSLEKHDPVAVNTRQVTLTGDLLDQVVSIEHAKTSLSFRLDTSKKPSLVVDLPDSMALVPGGYSLLFTLADKTTVGYVLTVQKNGA